ncbi:MAG: hypothetical protein NT166_01705 [Candidatus Aminicenantes bacterium]|nr:hypothetical protein [Candidatus Aminicenantes bacterium]
MPISFPAPVGCASNIIFKFTVVLDVPVDHKTDKGFQSVLVYKRVIDAAGVEKEGTGRKNHLRQFIQVGLIEIQYTGNVYTVREHDLFYI